MTTAAGKKLGGILRILFIAHLILSGWGMESTFRIPHSYVYYNIIFMMALMWAIANENTSSIGMALMMTIAIIIMDAVTLSIYWPLGGRGIPGTVRLYFAFAIANAALRGITAIVLYKVFQEVDAENEGLTGVFGDVVKSNGNSSKQGGSRQGYESVDGNNSAA